MKIILLILFLLFTFSYAQKFEFDVDAESVHLEDDILYIKTKSGKYKEIIFNKGEIKRSSFKPNNNKFKPRRILRDGIVTSSNKDIKHTWLYKQTLDYDHEILGDQIEAKAIAVLLKNKNKLTYELDEHHVFEDLKVRLYDINDDGKDELFVIKTHLDKGASLAMYRIENEKIVPSASTEYLNRTFRWLNVVGFSDFDGNGKKDVAIIKTPHIGGYLTIYEFNNNKFKQIYKRYGFTNHYIGSTELDMSAIFDLDDDKIDEFILVDMKAKNIKIANFKNKKFKVLKSIMNNSKVNSAILVKDLDNDGFKEIIYTLKNKKLVIYTYEFTKKEK